MPCRKLKHESSVPLSPGSSVQDDDISKTDPLVPNSPKRGRKESEQKRRVLMNQYFDELIVLLMLLGQKHVPQKMDKVATLKETIACLKVYYQLTHLEMPLSLPKDQISKYVISRGDALSLFLNSQDSFLVLVSESGRIMFSNSLVTSLLGYTQTKLIGQNWYDLVHEKDKELFQSLFKSSNGQHFSGSAMTVFPARKCTLHIQLYPGETGGQPQYLPFKCLSHHRECSISELAQQEPFSPGEVSGSVSPLLDKQQNFIVLIGKLPTSLSYIDLPIGTNDVNFDFELRVSKEGRIISIEEPAILIIGYSCSEIIGTSFFDYVDPYHLSDIAESISSLTKTGLGVTSPYRFMTKSGRYIWLISKAYTSYDPWINKPDHILFTNRVLSSDQVLPEHRFFRSRKLLPDPECEREYTIPTSAHVQPLPRKPLPPNVQQNPLIEKFVLESSSSMIGQGGIVNQQLNIPSSSEEHRRMPALPLLQLGQQQQGTMEQPTPWIGSHQRLLEPIPLPSATSSRSPQVPQELIEIQRELERKNREIFEMQQRMLEQEKLFEAERNQFYQVSQHVLNYITAGSQSNTSSNSKFLSSTAGGKKIDPFSPNLTNSQPRMFPQNSHSLQYNSQSGPTTPVSTFSPYSPASQMYQNHTPSPATVSNTMEAGLDQSNQSTHFGMYNPSSTSRSVYPPPPHFPPNSTHQPSEDVVFTDSLSMHNNMVCDALGLSSENQLPQQSTPIVSQIQALSNMFGGH